MKFEVEFFVACLLFLAVSASARSVESFDVNSTLSSCECLSKRCSCCEHIDWNRVRVKGTLCSNVTYLSEDYGISVTITYNTYTIFNETVSARNPPPICVGIPKLEDIRADVCVRFYDLTLENKHFHGCAKATISVYRMIHKSVDLGCWNMPDLADARINNSDRILRVVKNESKELSNEVPDVRMI